MILLLSFGQSSMTGFLALFFATLGFLTRAFMETIDETGKEAVEALEASGANWWQIVFQAVLPASLPQMISWVLFMIETNIRSSTLVGILTGTGIGFIFELYYKAFHMEYNYNAASLVVVCIVITVFIIEFISNYIRRVIL
jgi:phosphonate transport system permease protein